jgi:hypothetical protein
MHDRVFAVDWYAIVPPTPEELRAAWRARRTGGV